MKNTKLHPAGFQNLISIRNSICEPLPALAILSKKILSESQLVK